MRRRASALALLCLLPAMAGAADDPAQAQQELEALRGRLQALQRELAAGTSQLASEQRALRRAEKEEARLRRELAGLRRQIAASRERLAGLEADLATQRRSLAREIGLLERQLRAAWLAGREEWLKLLLSGDDPFATRRQLVHYRYLGRARSELIARVRGQLATLAAAAAEVSAEQARLTDLERARAQRLASLEQERESRRQAVARLDRALAGRRDELARLEEQAAALQSLVDDLSRAIVELAPDDDQPFGRRKGAMQWPVTGRLRHHYGEPRAGGRLRWEGALLAAPAGTEVRAVHHGRVVFADWLPGMGLLIVLDHGDGYLSLYGHNQDLVHEVGDWVQTGELLAHVGDSGGRDAAGLYFEIRKNGRPVDPRPWMRRAN